jgi:hypothetical protein
MSTSQNAAGSLEGQVPWYSIFWALVAFSTNSMAQPAGMVCGGPPYVSFLLRSSPIICIIDTLFLFCRLVYYMWTGSNFAEAHKSLLRLRFQSWDVGIDDKVDTFRSLQRDRAVRWILFAFLLPQILKLYFFQGLIWAKIIASMYLASFVVVELLVVWPRLPDSLTEKREKTIKASGALSLCYISCALAVAFLLWFSATALRDILGEPNHTLPKHLGLASFALSSLLVALGYVTCMHGCQSIRDALEPSFLLVLFLGIPWIYYAVEPQLSLRVSQPLTIQLVSAGLLVGWAAVGVLFATAVTAPTRKAAQEGEATQAAKVRRYQEKVAAWYFMILHVVTAILYLMYSYDPAGTFRPPWTECLG